VNALVDQVLEASEHGLSLIPCGGDKKPIGRWKRWQDERPNRQQLKRWARNPKATSWAIVAGAISGRVVVDLDGPEGEELVERWNLSPIVRTGRGGAHVHFSHPGWYVPTLNGKSKRALGERWPGVDVKGDGGYAITFGRSRFGEYVVLDRDLPVVGLEALPADFRRDVGLFEPAVSASTILSRYLARAVAPTNGNSGNRNELGFELACQLRDNRIDRSAAEQAMREYARQCPVGDYPLLENDALASLAQAYGRPPRQPWKVAPNPPGRDSTERTERSGENPRHERDSAVRSGTERSPNGDRTLRPKLALAERILVLHDDLVGKLGLVGERHVSRCTFLVHISRLLAEPAREVVKGDSSTGKSFATECALKAAAPEALYVRTQTSPLALFYSDKDFRHKTLVFFEANKLGDDDDPLARVLRTLISEGRLAYEVTVPEKRSSQLLEKEGPVAFISTTCRASLDREIETRVISLYSDNSDEQTSAVVRSILESASRTPRDPDLSEWYALDRWLAQGPREVVLPWAPALATFQLSGPPRLRRDISNLLALAKAHALLHRATREIDGQGRIVSTLDDYDVVRGLLADAMAIATDKAVREGTRKIVEAVVALRAEGAVRVSMSAASRKAGRSKSTTNTDVHDALEKGYLVSLSAAPERFDLAAGDPLPDQDDLLPKTEDLRRAFGRRSASVRPPTERSNPAPRAGFGESVRSVRSNTDQAVEDADIADFEPKRRCDVCGSTDRVREAKNGTRMCAGCWGDAA
jgi:Bifunctional DNA primase/polymerase, N-terminal